MSANLKQQTKWESQPALLACVTAAIVLVTCLFLTSTSYAQSEPSFQTFTREITIQPGDTLSHIALRELQDEALVEKIATINKIPVQKILIPGEQLLIPVELPIRNEFATVIFAKGEVTLNGEAVSFDDEVRVNDRLETGQTGYISLSFQTGTLINLQPNTIARIVTLYCQPGDDSCIIEMFADQGTLTSDVQRDGEQPTNFRVQTPYASAAVRGTVFYVDADDTGLRVGVTEGNVELGANESDQRQPLDTGFGSVTQTSGLIGEPIELLPAPVFRFVPPRIAKGDYLRWFDLTDVAEYIVQIAASANGVGVLEDTVVPTDLYTLTNDLPTGDYSVLVKAVDSNGLMGYTASSPITVAEIDPAVPSVSATVIREDDDYRINIIDAPEDALGFEVQVAADENFSDPVSVDIDGTGEALVRFNGEKLFARARVLVNRTTVGAFGEPSSVQD